MSPSAVQSQPIERIIRSVYLQPLPQQKTVQIKLMSLDDVQRENMFVNDRDIKV